MRLPFHIIFFLLLLSLFPGFFLHAQGYAIGQVRLTFTDVSRNDREISAYVFYPALNAGEEVPCAPGTFPVLSLGHGFVMSIDAYHNFRDMLVPEGFVLALIDTETGASPSHNDFGLDLAFAIHAIQAFSMDTASLLYSHINSKSVVLGHSMGGGASFLAAAADPLITALVGFAPAETNPSAIYAAGQIYQPTLLFAGEEDCVTPPAQHPVPMFNALASACKTYVSIEGGGHCYFANYNLLCSIGENLCFPNLTISREEQQARTFSLLIPWLHCVLEGESNACAAFMDTLALATGINYVHSCPSLFIPGSGKLNLPVRLIPNPFRQRLALLSDIPLEKISIWDAQGRLYFFNAFPRLATTWEADTSKLIPGIYFIHIETRDGRSFSLKGIKLP